MSAERKIDEQYERLIKVLNGFLNHDEALDFDGDKLAVISSPVIDNTSDSLTGIWAVIRPKSGTDVVMLNLMALGGTPRTDQSSASGFIKAERITVGHGGALYEQSYSTSDPVTRLLDCGELASMLADAVSATPEQSYQVAHDINRSPTYTLPEEWQVPAYDALLAAEAAMAKERSSSGTVSGAFKRLMGALSIR